MLGRVLSLLKVPGVLPVALGLLALLSALGGFAWLQTTRLTASEQARTAQTETIGTLRQRVLDDAVRIAQRDTLIAKQNQAVAAIGKASAEGQAAYQARNAQADVAARKLKATADSIMATTIATADELDRCRSAVSLIHDTLSKE
jgi:cytoskeletal protein RodZ